MLSAVAIAVMLVGHLLDCIAARLLYVAYGDELHVLLLEEAAEVICSPVTDADAAHGDSLAWRHTAVATENRAGNNRKTSRGKSSPGSTFQKTTTRYTRGMSVFHDLTPPVFVKRRGAAAMCGYV
jgi:hypothetical protein